MAHQEDYRGPRGGYGNEMQGRDMHGGMQGRGSQQWGAEDGGWGRSGPDQYGMESGGNWQRQGERYGQGSNENYNQSYDQGQGWQGQGRGQQGYGGNAGEQGRWSGMDRDYGQNRPQQGQFGRHGESFQGNQMQGGQGGSWNESRWDQGRGNAWQGGGRDYGWSPSEGYNTQPYSSGGYYGGGGYYGRESGNPSYGNFNPGTYGGQQSGRGNMGQGQGLQRGEYASGYTGEPMFSGGGMYGNYGNSGSYGGQQMERQGGFGRQSHAGRGPRGYHRSDDRIREDVNEELTRHPEIDASEIEVRVEHGEVTLTGTVEDRHAKRLAEDIAERCSGVEDVRNELRVDRGAREGQEGRSSRHGMSDREVPRRTANETNRSGSSTGNRSGGSSREHEGTTNETRSASGTSGAGGSSGTHGESETGRGKNAAKSSS
jgi:osmotically-inducible protein OsmY